jgi:hypothetical protein
MSMMFVWSSKVGNEGGRNHMTKHPRPLVVIVVAWSLAYLGACSEEGVKYTKIDDMEGTTGRIEWTPPGGALPGGWGSFADAQCDSLLPMPSSAGGTWSYESLPAPYRPLPGITSTSAARLRTTSPLINQYGAGMGVDFAVPARAAGAPAQAPGCVPSAELTLPPALPVDLTAYRGISFWGMATPGAGETRVLIEVDDNNTHPRGGRCDPKAPTNPQTACFNSFALEVNLTGAFQQYTLDFSQLKQGTWGYRADPSALDLAKVYALNFLVLTPGGACFAPARCAGDPPTLTFDIWIDDLYFVDR